MKITIHNGENVTIHDDAIKLVSLSKADEPEGRFADLCKDLKSDVRFVYGDKMFFFDYGKNAEGSYKSVLIKHEEGDVIYHLPSTHYGYCLSIVRPLLR